MDEGPLQGGNYGPYIQSERKAIYQEYAQQLIKTKAAYYCFCDQERLDLLRDENGVRRYDKHCLHLSEAENSSEIPHPEYHMWFAKTCQPKEKVSFVDLVYGEVTVPNAELEDHVLLKSDGMPTYNFANVIDDHLMKITMWCVVMNIYLQRRSITYYMMRLVGNDLNIFT